MKNTDNYKEDLKEISIQVHWRIGFSQCLGVERRKRRNRLQYQLTAASLSRGQSNVTVRRRNSLTVRRNRLDTANRRAILLENLRHFIFPGSLHMLLKLGLRWIQFSKPLATIQSGGGTNSKKRRTRWFIALQGERLLSQLSDIQNIIKR